MKEPLPYCDFPLPCTFRGTVETGKQLGRKLGFPTANLILPGDAVTPPYGVYVCTLTVNGEDFPAVTNVGRHPTTPDGPATVESHILTPGNHDLYGKQVTATLYAFLRPEQRFSGIEELIAAIDKNKRQALEWFAENPGALKHRSRETGL
ncbi:MAG: riboflavin kinase [Clostridia bacterium]|nr:riboflavin kinase [Clostridia bacterium]